MNSKLQTVAFYNIENLFDIYNDEQTNDDDFLPTSAKKWTAKRYGKKIYKVGSVISKIGFEFTNNPPALVGLAEVENDLVLKDLIKSEDLSNYDYGFVHYESGDERGIDVALLYDRNEFQVESSQTYSVDIKTSEGEKDFTRDILLVTGILDGDKLHILVNHWPSRRDGEDESAYKRIITAKKVMDIISELKLQYESPKIIVMGDFNDNPNDESVMLMKDNAELFNPMETLLTHERGSQNHDFKWNLFDQILCSQNLLTSNQNGYSFESADIFDDQFLTQYHGKYQGQPFRTYVGKKYMGGFSDHFPVYMYLKKKAH